MVDVPSDINTLYTDDRSPYRELVMVHVRIDKLALSRLVAPLLVVLPLLHQHVVAEELLDVFVVEVHMDLGPAVHTRSLVCGRREGPARTLEEDFAVPVVVGREVLERVTPHTLALKLLSVLTPSTFSLGSGRRGLVGRALA